MSADTAAATAPSAKRPLEDPSSPSAPTDLPDAKRPALDKVVKDDQDVFPAANQDAAATAAAPSSTPTATATATILAPEEGETSIDAAAAAAAATTTTNGTDAGAAATSTSEPATANGASASESQSIPSLSAQHDNVTAHPLNTAALQDETKWIHIRAVISSAEAATCIGKGGENVTQIRKLSGAKCTVSDYSRGAVERILTVSGPQDAVAKAFGLIIRTLNNEPLEQPSTAQSKTYPLRLLIPHILIGSIIGKSGVRIREIQEASGARLNASDSCLPLSTERSLVVLGVADSVHIATYYIAVTLVEQLTERFGGPAASAYATRSGGPAGVVPGGMQVVPYVPQPAGGQYGHPDMYKRHNTQPPQPRAGPPHPGAYGQPHGVVPAAHAAYAQQPAPYATSPRQPGFNAAGAAGAGAAGGAPQQAGRYAVPQQPGQPAAHGQPIGSMPGQPITQQIYIPNDMVGAIIGKGGSKINEIRTLSGSVIKINEPQDNSNERLVTITGTAECNQMALYMLYTRLENEKHRI